jgi:hypothetical protein
MRAFATKLMKSLRDLTLREIEILVGRSKSSVARDLNNNQFILNVEK